MAKYKALKKTQFDGVLRYEGHVVSVPDDRKMNTAVWECIEAPKKDAPKKAAAKKKDADPLT